MANEVKGSKLNNARKAIFKYSKEVRNELKKVIWLTRTQLINNTFTVLASCLIIGAMIWAVDAGLTLLVKRFLTGE